MKELLLQKRKLLFYLDLGITGESITNGYGIISKGVSSTNQTTSASPGTTTASNDFKTWNAYSNGDWPHLFLADRQGLLRL
jgi:hypothetical protein